MEWLQETTDFSIDTYSKKCPCYGAKCRGRCAAYGVCPMHWGDKCNQLIICGVHLG